MTLLFLCCYGILETLTIAMTLFGTSDIKSLNVRSRLRIAHELRHGYAATVKQVSRMVYLDTESLEGFI